MTHIHKETLIDTPLEKVVEFVRDPHHWNDWYVGLSPAENVTGDGGTGTVVRHHYQMAGINFPVTTKITERTEGPKEAVSRMTFEGPITGKQTFVYKAVGDERTEVKLDIDYTVPGKALGRIADNLLIERLQDKAMEHSLLNMKMMAESNAFVTATTR